MDGTIQVLLENSELSLVHQKEKFVGLVCSFCDKPYSVENVYLLDGTKREDGKTVICDKCENKHRIV